MGRVGILPDELRISRGRLEEAVSEVEKMASLPGLDIQGIYTHFASADSRDRSYTRYQIEVFKNFVDDLSKAGIEFLFCHAANSAAIIDHPESHLDMVRAGISMYGLYPSHGVNRSKVDLLPAMTWKARITCIKKVKKGFPCQLRHDIYNRQGYRACNCCGRLCRWIFPQSLLQG